MSLRDQLQSTLTGQYILDRELSGGGMSRVFVAEESRLKRTVVIKVLSPELAEGISVERFEREIQTVAALQHANIVPVLTAGDSEGLPYYTMPFVEGESLRNQLARGPLAVRDVISILRDVAKALAYAHQRGVVHRDIKPDNILISGGVAVVTDFGIAKAISVSRTTGAPTLTQVGTSIGTPAYMAPEQAAGDPNVDHRADIYALGATAYELLTGESVFAGRTPQRMLAAHMTEAPEPIESRRADLPPALARLVMMCLAKDPAARPTSAESIVSALEADNTPVAGGAIAASSRRPAVSRNRLIGVATAVIVVAAIAWIGASRAAASSFVASRVAVAPCENLTHDTALVQLGRIASEYLTQQLSRLDTLDVVASTTVQGILGGANSANRDAARRIADATRAEYVITCSVAKLGDTITARAEILDGRSGAVKNEIDPGVGAASEPLVAVARVGERMLSAMLAPFNKERPPVYAAYQAFDEGADVALGRFDWPAAIPHFQKAVLLDSTFATAYWWLGTAYQLTMNWDGLDSVVAKLNARRDELPPVERVVADQLSASARGDFEGMLRASSAHLVRDPTNISWGYLVGTAATSLLQPKVALEGLRIAEPFAMRSALQSLHAELKAYDYHALGDHRTELEILRAANRKFPSFVFLQESTLGAYAGLHDATAGLALADTMLLNATDAADPDPAVAVARGAEEFRAHGDSATAARLLDRANKWLQQHPLQKPGRMRYAIAGLILSLSGEFDSAATQYRAAAASPTHGLGNQTTMTPRSESLINYVATSLEVAGRLGLLAARRGDKVRAELLADSLTVMRTKHAFGDDSYWRAAIFAALGRKDEAVTLLRQAGKEGRAKFGWHADDALSALRGYAPFMTLIEPVR